MVMTMLDDDDGQQRDILLQLSTQKRKEYGTKIRKHKLKPKYFNQKI